MCTLVELVNTPESYFIYLKKRQARVQNALNCTPDVLPKLRITIKASYQTTKWTKVHLNTITQTRTDVGCNSSPERPDLGMRPWKNLFNFCEKLHHNLIVFFLCKYVLVLCCQGLFTSLFVFLFSQHRIYWCVETRGISEWSHQGADGKMSPLPTGTQWCWDGGLSGWPSSGGGGGGGGDVCICNSGLIVYEN